MVSCRRCGRTLTYPRSIRHGCGSFCYYKKGCPPVGSQRMAPEQQAERQPNRWKPLTRALLIGAAMGVSCVLAHVACIAAAFIKKHDLVFKGASLIYEEIKARHSHDQSYSPIITEPGSIAFNRLSRSERDSISRFVGKEISGYAGNYNIPERVSEPIAENTVSRVISSGSSVAFNWGSKMLMR